MSWHRNHFLHLECACERLQAPDSLLGGRVRSEIGSQGVAERVCEFTGRRVGRRSGGLVEILLHADEDCGGGLRIVPGCGGKPETFGIGFEFLVGREGHSGEAVEESREGSQAVLILVLLDGMAEIDVRDFVAENFGEFGIGMGEGEHRIGHDDLTSGEGEGVQHGGLDDVELVGDGMAVDVDEQRLRHADELLGSYGIFGPGHGLEQIDA